MRLKDLVANSLPRVRGRKGKNSSQSQDQTHTSHAQQGDGVISVSNYPPSSFNCHNANEIKSSRAVFESRESSVERSSTVAVVDAPWRENKTYQGRSRQVDLSMMPMGGSVSCYPVLPTQHRGMVMSHSADGIASSHAGAMTTFMASQRDESNAMVASHYVSNSALPNSVVTYMGPGYVYHSQHQHQHQHHHHHHHHNHRDYHYIYHHHHHDRHHHYPTNIPQQTTAPLGDRNSRCNNSSSRTASSNSTSKHTDVHQEKPEKKGFLGRSFASFRAIRKHSRKSKNDNEHSLDENGKNISCPNPKKSDSQNGAHKKAPKQTKWRKSKHNTRDNHGDACWHSDSEAKIVEHSHRVYHHQNEAVPYATINRFPIRECTISPHFTGSHDAVDAPSLENVSISGYDSDVSKNRSVRPRSRIKTNPWLPSPQPSLALGRRINNDRSQDLPEDSMEEEVSNNFPRSASFDYHRQAGVSTFLSSSMQEHKRHGVQRHRSLTPIDLKINISLPRSKKPDTAASQQSGNDNDIIEKSHMNDLNTKRPKSRPNSILSPNSEFIALADNIEQLANNISFEYEDTCPNCSTKSNNLANHDCCTSNIIDRKEILEEETRCKKRRSDSAVFPTPLVSPDNANSPDSGIGCLGSCDGDDVSHSNVDASNDTCASSSTTPENMNTSFCANQILKKNIQEDFEANIVQSQKEDFGFKTKNQNYKYSTNVSGLSSSRKSSLNSQSLVGSSSSESILSGAEVSESDIDNTSYNKCVDDHMTRSVLVVDLPRSRQSPGTVRVEERSEHDFRSLPWKIRGIGYRQEKVDGENSGVSATNETYFASLDRKVFKHSDIENCGASKIITNDNGGKNESNLDLLKKSMKTSHLKKYRGDLASNNSSMDQLRREETELKYLAESLERQSTEIGSLTKTEPSAQNKVLGSHEGHKLDKSDFSDCFNRSQNGNDNQNRALALSKQKEKQENKISTALQIDMTDACIQTDFPTDFEYWDNNSGLSPLDDSFDPVESTRHWLLWGNMQGSADTGYSSQPRDSQVFQDDDSNMAVDDILSDTESGGLSQNHYHAQHAQNKMAVDLSPDDGNKYPLLETPEAFRDVPQQSPRSNNGSLKLKQNLITGNNSSSGEMQNIANNAVSSNFNPVVRRESNTKDDTDPSKRHSSDSSTSTLTSDLQSVDIEVGDQSNISEGYVNSSISMNPSKYNEERQLNDDLNNHDYINLPVRNLSLLHKTQNSDKRLSHSSNKMDISEKGICQSSGLTKGDDNNKTFQNKDEHSKFRTKRVTNSNSNINKVSTNDNRNNIEFKNDSKLFKDNDNENFHLEAFNRVEQELVKDIISNQSDKADYLEFLKDASLSNSHTGSHGVFIVPGFGPLEYLSNKTNPCYGDERKNIVMNPTNYKDFKQTSIDINGVERKGLGSTMMDNKCEDSKKLNNNKKSPSGKNDAYKPGSSSNRVRSSRKQEKSVKEEKQHNVTGSQRSNSNLSASYVDIVPTEKSKTSNNRGHAVSEKVVTGYDQKQQAKSKSGTSPPQVPAKPRRSHSQSSKYNQQPTSKNEPKFCPIVQSYDLDRYTNFPSYNGAGFEDTAQGQREASLKTHHNDVNVSNSDSPRSIAERVSFLEREKEMIYRQIQDLQQQQQLSRQKQQLQRHRTAHSHRKEELLGTLRDLKVKLEEQSRRLQSANREEV